MSALEKGLWDILTFNCGRRPLIRSEHELYGMVLGRFDRG
jgi:hypothetical protein